MTQPVGVILAAGFAARMGRPKQLLPYRDTTLLGAVIAAARASALDRVILVLGAHRAEIVAAHDLEGIDVVENPHPQRGNLSSLRLAAARAPDAPLLLLMGDMPGVDPLVIDAQLERWRQQPGWLRVTEYTDGRGHPFVLSPELIGELDQLEGPKPLWALSQHDRADTLVVPGPMPVDVDTPDDYRKAVARRRPQR